MRWIYTADTHSKKAAWASCFGLINLSPPGESFGNWRQPHSCCLQVGVSLPSGLISLLGPLTQTECTSPDTLGLPRGWDPVRLSVFVCQRVFVKQRGCWLSLYWHVETLTVHAHGRCGLHRPERGGVVGVTCQLPPVVRAQSSDPLRGNRKGRRRERGKRQFIQNHTKC